MPTGKRPNQVQIIVAHKNSMRDWEIPLASSSSSVCTNISMMAITAVIPISWVSRVVKAQMSRMSSTPLLPLALAMTLRMRWIRLVLPMAPAITIMVAIRIVVVLEKPENAVFTSITPVSARAIIQVIAVRP